MSAESWKYQKDGKRCYDKLVTALKINIFISIEQMVFHFHV